MSDIQSTEIPANQEQNGEDGLSLIDLLLIFARHKKLTIGMPVVVAICTVMLTLMLPKSYMASVKILPPQQPQSVASALLSQLGGASGAAAAVAGIKNTNDLFVGMLKSRTIADNLIQRFDLKRVYDMEMMVDSRKELDSNTKIATGKDGLISVDVEDHDPNRAAEIANGYADELLKLTKTIAVTEASKRRLFYERQLETAKDNFARAEALLKGSLATGGVISVDSDSRAMVETAAKLSAQITAKEIQLNAMQAFVTTNNQEFKQAQQQLESARAELLKLENGGLIGSGKGRPSQSDKQSGLENVKILREVKYQQMLYELLSRQYEIARLDEAKDASVVQVLDKAVVPERKSKPHRALIVLFSTLIAFVFGSIVAIFLELQKKALQRPEYSEKVGLLKRSIGYKR